MAITIASLSDKNGNIREIAPKGLEHDVTFKTSGKITGSSSATKLYSGDQTNLDVVINVTDASIATSDLTGTIATSQIEDGAVTRAKLGADVHTDSVIDGSSKLLTSNGAYDNLVKKAGDTMTGSLNMRAPSGESSVKVFKGGSTGDDAQRMDLFFGEDGSRGLWDKTKGDIIDISDTDAYFHGVADTSDWSGGANRLNLSEWSYIGAFDKDTSTRILELGYLELKHTYQHIELLFTSGFYNNQHYSSDLIHIFADNATSYNVAVGRTMLMQKGDGRNRTFYALLDGDKSKLYLYVHLGAGDFNGYGRWNVSVLGSNVGGNKNDCVWTPTWATEIPKGDAMAEVPITGSVNKSSTSDLATTATNYSATGGIATALEGKQSTLPIKDSIYQIGVLSSLNSSNAVEANKSHCDGGGNNIMGSYGASIDIVNTNVLQLINMNGEVISTKTLPYTAVVFNQTGSAENVLYCL